MQLESASLDWYTHRSAELGVTPRCPFATASRCPRYFQSLVLLGDCGATKIDPGLEATLTHKWKRSDLWPLVAENETTVYRSDGEARIFANFCPEVIGETFALFAVSMARYGDEIDIGLSHRHLAAIKADSDDWRWNWSSVQRMHYTNCSTYSLLLHEPLSSTTDEIVEVKPGAFGVSVNLRALFRWLTAKFPYLKPKRLPRG